MSLLIEGGHSQTRGNKEVTAFCPECGDFASLSFTRQGLVATPEYIQAHSHRFRKLHHKRIQSNQTWKKTPVSLR